MKFIKNPSVIAGFCGGAAPIVANLAKTLVSEGSPGNFNHWTILGLVMFGVLGAFVAYFIENTDPKKAFVSGISAPAMITLLATPQQSQLQENTDVQNNVPNAIGMIFFGSSVHAQEADPAPPDPVEAENRSFEISSETSLNELHIAILDENGHEILGKNLNGRDFQQIDLPAEASSYQISSEIGTTDNRPLAHEPDSTLYLSIRTRSERKPAIRQIFGLSSKVEESYRLREEPVQRVPASTTGWVFMGVRSGDVWQSLYLDLPVDMSSDAIPSPGTLVRPNFPLNIRPEPNGDELLGTLRVGQVIRISEVRNTGENKYWCLMEVVE